ncbi:NAD-dependent malic enzyme [bacterium]|nr:NAD-dependent malic enzyme [bacterium]
MSIERYQKWRDHKGRPFTPVSLDGLALISDRNLNKGTAFTKEEREEFHLKGLIPPQVSTLENQKARVYEGYCSAPTDIDKYIYLRSLQDRNETLYYSLIEEHIEEMIPIIYIPTVAEACLQFSHHYQRARGLYITKDNVDDMQEMTHHFPSQSVQIIVVTDSQGILGIHDIGVGGMAVPIGKLALYTLGSGIHPSFCLPIALDIGTDNEELLRDPLYLGVEHKRIKGEEYEEFIRKFVTNVKLAFPRAVLQWEDFSKEHSFALLEKYRETIPSYNDDIQGTGALVMAGVINSMKIKKENPVDQVYAVFGAGSGGVGFARQLHVELMSGGLSSDDAYDKIFLIDSKGVALRNREGLEYWKKPFAKDPGLISGWKLKGDNPVLIDVIENAKVTVLVGISGKARAFTKEHVDSMMKFTDRPVIFPLTNPAEKSEATPKDLYQWSGGKAIVATGSFYPDLEYNGKKVQIGQASNAFIFPGVGLAVCISKIKIITDEIFSTAAHALAGCVSAKDLEDGIVYPQIKDIRKIGLRVATDVLKTILQRNPDIGFKLDELHEVVHSRVWKPLYQPYRRV